MMQEHSSNDPIQIWRNQDREGRKVFLEEIREKVRKLQRTRRRVMLACFTGFVAVGVPLLVQILRASTRTSPRVVDVLAGWMFVGGFAYLAYISYRGLREKRLPPDAGLKPSIAAYREYYGWERSHARRSMLVMALIMIGPIIVAVKLWTEVPVFPLATALKSAVGFAAMYGLFFVGYKIHMRRVDRESETLDRLESDTR